jgi:hypothetical protein
MTPSALSHASLGRRRPGAAPYERARTTHRLFLVPSASHAVKGETCS